MSEQHGDKWYFGFRCDKCNALVPIAEDPSRGTVEIKFQSSGAPGSAILTVPCPRCGHRGQYPVEQAKPYPAD